MSKAMMKQPIWQRIVGLSVIFALILTIFGATFSARADDEDETMSFYKVSSNISKLVSNAMAPGKKGEKIPDQWKSITDNAGNAGAVLGYVDPDFSFSLDWLASRATGSSAVVSYKTLAEAGGEGNGNKSTDLSGLLGYAQYGAALNQLGFVSSSGGIFTGMLSFLGGGLMLLVFSLASAIEGIFRMTVNVLNLLNPFRFFINAVNDAQQKQMISGDPPGVFDGITKFIAEWYTILIDLSWIIIVPVFIAVLVFGLVTNKKVKEQRGSKIKMLLIRISYIAIGLPVLASLYTASLDSFQNSMVGKDSGAGAQSIILSTYLDFQAWAMPGAGSELGPLGLPGGEKIEAKWDEKTGTISKPDAANGNLQGLTKAINAGTGRYPGVYGNTSNIDSNYDGAAIAKALADKSETVDDTSYGQMIDLLLRYMGNESVLSSDYETYWKALVTSNNRGDDGSINGGSEGEPSTPSGGADNEGLLRQFDELRKANKLKEVDAKYIDGDAAVTTSLGSLLIAKDDEPLKAEEAGGTVTFSGSGGLSPVSAYNFLNTDFRSNSLVVSSAEQTSSFKARDTISSVSQVGSGFMGFMYWVNALVILLAYTVVGLFYGLGMLFGVIKKGLNMIIAVPFATVGAIAGIAKVIIYTIAMLVEIFGTMFLYQIVSEFLLNINTLISGPMSGAISGLGIIGSLLGLLSILLSTIIAFVFMIVALKLRKSMLKAINEAITKFINRFMETSINTPSSSSPLAGAAKGALAGAGMAAAGNKFLKGSSDGGVPGSPGSMLGFGGTELSDDGGSGSPLIGGFGPDSPSGGDSVNVSDSGAPDGGMALLPSGNDGGGDAGVAGGAGTGGNGSDSASNEVTNDLVAGESGESSLSNNAQDDKSLADQVQANNGLTQRGLQAGDAAGDGESGGVVAGMGSGESGDSGKPDLKNIKAGDAVSAGVSGTKAVLKAKSGDLGGAAKDASATAGKLRKMQADSKGGSGGSNTPHAGKNSSPVMGGSSTGKDIGSANAKSATASSNNSTAANLLSTMQNNPIATAAAMGAVNGAAKGTKAESVANAATGAASMAMLSGGSGAGRSARSLPKPATPTRQAPARKITPVQHKPNPSQLEPKSSASVVNKPNPSRTLRGGNN